MEYTDYMIWKALALFALAFLGGLFGWFNPWREEEPRDKPPE
jgi:hypothetical protein